MRAVLLPNQTIMHTFLLEAKDNMKTSKKILSEIEGYINDLKKYKKPDGDTFNGVMTDVKLITTDGMGGKKPRPMPKYALRATIRQMVGS